MSSDVTRRIVSKTSELNRGHQQHEKSAIMAKISSQLSVSRLFRLLLGATDVDTIVSTPPSSQGRFMARHPPARSDCGSISEHAQDTQQKLGKSHANATTELQSLL
jgi:hypothetical protein